MHEIDDTASRPSSNGARGGQGRTPRIDLSWTSTAWIPRLLRALVRPSRAAYGARLLSAVRRICSQLLDRRMGGRGGFPAVRSLRRHGPGGPRCIPRHSPASPSGGSGREATPERPGNDLCALDSAPTALVQLPASRHQPMPLRLWTPTLSCRGRDRRMRARAGPSRAAGSRNSPGPTGQHPVTSMPERWRRKLNSSSARAETEREHAEQNCDDRERDQVRRAERTEDRPRSGSMK